MKAIWQHLLNDKSGASAAEYALVLALVAGIIVVGVSQLAPPINTIFNNMGAQIVNVNGNIGK